MNKEVIVKDKKQAPPFPVMEEGFINEDMKKKYEEIMSRKKIVTLKKKDKK